MKNRTKAPGIPWWNTVFDADEVASIERAIAGRCISQGRVTAEFEALIAKRLGVPHVVCTTSGSSALLLSLIAAGVGVGDEVIVPNRTWIATAHAPFLLGAKVVLADVRPERPVIDCGQLERLITRRTRAILPVHLNGRAVDMEAVNRIARAHRLTVIEDAAQAFCSRNEAGLLGCQSLAGCFSLSVPKIISTGQGGFIATRDADFCERLKLARSHGVSDLLNVAYTRMGFNFKFTDIQAAIGLVQMGRLERRLAHVKTIYRKYQEGLRDLKFLEFPFIDVDRGEIPLYAEVLCRRRAELVNFLKEGGIETRPLFPDLNLAAYFKNRRRFPNSVRFGRDGLYLPCGPDQPLENVERVIERLHRFKRKP